jgi:ubiquinone/menaquinone biosynthesis C-methylase UbiE
MSAGPDAMMKALLFRQGWTKPETIQSYDSGRNPFRGCASKIVRSVLGKHLQQEGGILEVGSGLGELLRLAPELEGRLVQSEQSAKMAKENLRMHPNSKIVVADAHALPFGDAVFDAVVGFSSFDTFEDLPAAVKETKRVLAQKGRFIHFLDMIACENPLLYTLACSNKVGFPSFETAANGKMALNSFLVVSREEAEIAVRQIPEPALRKLVSAYVSDPVITYHLLSRDDPPMLALMAALLDAIGLKGDIVPHTEYFTYSLARALRSEGFAVRSYKVYDEEIVKSSVDLEVLAGRPLHNSYLKDVGVVMSRLEGGLGFGNARVRLGMHVMVAEKQQSGGHA